MKALLFIRVYCLVLLVLSICFLSGCSKSVRKVSSATIDEATLHSIAGDNDTSSQIANKSPEALLYSAFVYIARRNYTLANMHLVMALKKQPELPMAYIGLGRISQEQGDFEGAEINYNKALAIQPDMLQARIGLAQTFRLEGQLKKAINEINESMTIAPNDVRILEELAILYDILGKDELAEPLHKEVVELSPQQASSYNNLGMSYLLKKEYAKAIVQFEQATNINRDDKLIRNNLAMAYLLYGDKDTALAIFQETVGKAAAYNNIGYLLFTQGKLDEAEDALITALKINPKYYNRAQENLERVRLLRKTRKLN